MSVGVLGILAALVVLALVGLVLWLFGGDRQ